MTTHEMQAKFGGRTTATAAGGFTLVEVLVALFVLAVGLLGLASLQLNASRGNAQSGVGTRAVLIAQSRMEMLKSAAFADIKDGSGLSTLCNEDVKIKNSVGADVVFFQVTCTYAPQDTDGDGVDDLVDLDVTVQYPGASTPVHLISSRTSA